MVSAAVSSARASRTRGRGSRGGTSRCSDFPCGRRGGVRASRTRHVLGDLDGVAVDGDEAARARR